MHSPVLAFCVFSIAYCVALSGFHEIIEYDGPISLGVHEDLYFNNLTNVYFSMIISYVKIQANLLAKVDL